MDLSNVIDPSFDLVIFELLTEESCRKSSESNSDGTMTVIDR